MKGLDALLAEQVAYYRALAPEYLEDAGVEGVTVETQDTTARAIVAPELLLVSATPRPVASLADRQEPLKLPTSRTGGSKKPPGTPVR